MAMLEIVVSGIRGGLLQIAQNGFRPLDSKVPQEAAAALPKFEIGCLDQILHQRPRRLAPPRGGAHNSEADGSSDPRNELLPNLAITRFGAEAHDVLQRQRRIPRRSKGVRHSAVSDQNLG